MKELIFEKNDTILSCINKILVTQDEEIKIVIPEGSVLFKQKNNLKTFLKTLRISGKLYKIETTSVLGKEFLRELNSEEDTNPMFHEFSDEKSYSDTVESKNGFQFVNKKTNNFNIALPKINFNFPSFFGKKFKVLILGMLLISVVGVVSYYFLISSNKANVVLKVSSERFVKSFEVRLSSLSNTSVENKVLNVTKVSQNFETSKDIPATGKIDGGTKATGEIRFSNSTDKVISLKTNSKLVYKDSNKKELTYFLKENVTIPKRTLTATNPDTYINGEVTADIVAAEFGSSFNISAGKTVSIDSYEASELKGIVSSSLDGGIKTSLNAVSDSDIKNLSNLSIEDLKQRTQSFSNPGNVFLRNTQLYTITEEKFSHKLSEPTDVLKLNQKVNLSYLQYNEQEAKKFVQALVSGLVPKGYELYGKELQIEIGVLGLINTLGSPNDEANGQLTVRSYKIPVIDSDAVAKNLTGKSVTQAKEYLDSLGIYYDIESNSLINIFGFPNDVTKINVSVENE